MPAYMSSDAEGVAFMMSSSTCALQSAWRTEWLLVSHSVVETRMALTHKVESSDSVEMLFPDFHEYTFEKRHLQDAYI
jgi:hypothetical protein